MGDQNGVRMEMRGERKTRGARDCRQGGRWEREQLGWGAERRWHFW